MSKGFPRWIRRDADSEVVYKSISKLASLLAVPPSQQKPTKVGSGAGGRSGKGDCLTPR